LKPGWRCRGVVEYHDPAWDQHQTNGVRKLLSKYKQLWRSHGLVNVNSVKIKNMEGWFLDLSMERR
jgi:hypothetical protein